jgi:tetratricopeptide (TPR) repeat protein
MLELSTVTLCCVDTRNHALALRALERSREGVHFARSVMLTDALPRGIAVPQGIDIVSIPDVASRDAYSEFVLKALLSHIATAHVLLVQWDGYVVNPAAWEPAFLDYDYIGAKWFWAEAGKRVGNGGFSLRSRNLLQALQDPRIRLIDNEDVTICREFRPLLEQERGIRFADEALADRFSFEAAYPIGKPFGFHGLFNFCRTVPAAEIAALAPNFSDAIARSPAARPARAQLRRAWNVGRGRRNRTAHPGPQRRITDEGEHCFLRRRERISRILRSSGAMSRVRAAAAASTSSATARSKGDRTAEAAGAPATAPHAKPLDTEARVARALAQHQRASMRVPRANIARRSRSPPIIRRRFTTSASSCTSDAISTLRSPLLERSAQAVPGEPEFHNNLGLALAAADRIDEAITSYRRALALKPGHAVAWNNLGLALQEQTDFAGAIAAFRRAIEIDSQFARARWNLSLALLDDGQFAEGFREYEWRLAIDELGKGRYPLEGPLWDGASPRGKTLLVHTEQGLGDALQFARYLTLLAERGARPLIQCSAALRNLLATVPGVAQAFGPGEPLPHYDAHVALPLAAHGLRDRRASCAGPRCLTHRISRASGPRWRESFARHPPPRLRVRRIGPAARRTRTIEPLDDARALAPLSCVPGIAWHSLQLGADRRESSARRPHRASYLCRPTFPSMGPAGDHHASSISW